MDVAPLEDVAVPEGAASSAPGPKASSDSHPLDDKLLKDLADGDPTQEREMKRAAAAPEHLRSHFPKNSQDCCCLWILAPVGTSYFFAIRNQQSGFFSSCGPQIP